MTAAVPAAIPIAIAIAIPIAIAIAIWMGTSPGNRQEAREYIVSGAHVSLDSAEEVLIPPGSPAIVLVLVLRPRPRLCS